MEQTSLIGMQNETAILETSLVISYLPHDPRIPLLHI